MDRFSDLFKKITALFWTASEAGLALISLILVVYLLLGGDSGTFTMSVVSNLSLLIEAPNSPSDSISCNYICCLRMDAKKKLIQNLVTKSYLQFI